MLGRVVFFTILGSKGFALGPVLLIGGIVGAAVAGVSYLAGDAHGRAEAEAEKDEETDGPAT